MFQTRDKQGRRGKAPFRVAMTAFAMAFLASWPLKAMAEPPAAAPVATPLTIVAFGDSLTAGYLLPPDAGFPEQLRQCVSGHSTYPRCSFPALPNVPASHFYRVFSDSVTFLC